MEHKIGEILKYLDDWYQCVERPSDYKGCACNICSLNMIGCYGVQGCDGSFRADKKSVVFKKLEKIGEPFMYEKKTCQTYQLYTPTNLKMQPDEVQAISVSRGNYTADIEIKQNERNKSMEEKLKEYFETATEEQLKNDFEVLKRFNEPGIPVQEFIESQMSHHLKPFDLEAAKAGKPIYTRDESTKERQAIVEESYVSLDTAKILKEVGFKEPCRIHYTNSGGTWEGAIPTTMDDVGKFVFFPCPTHALVARWLREKHTIHVLITPLLDGWMIDLFDLTKHQYLLCNKDAVADTYEEAFEEGIQEAIKLIKK